MFYVCDQPLNSIINISITDFDISYNSFSVGTSSPEHNIVNQTSIFLRDFLYHQIL